jgi:hypothetical protein
VHVPSGHKIGDSWLQAGGVGQSLGSILQVLSKQIYGAWLEQVTEVPHKFALDVHEPSGQRSKP